MEVGEMCIGWRSVEGRPRVHMLVRSTTPGPTRGPGGAREMGAGRCGIPRAHAPVVMSQLSCTRNLIPSMPRRLNPVGEPLVLFTVRIFLPHSESSHHARKHTQLCPMRELNSTQDSTCPLHKGHIQHNMKSMVTQDRGAPLQK